MRPLADRPWKTGELEFVLGQSGGALAACALEARAVEVGAGEVGRQLGWRRAHPQRHRAVAEEAQ